MFEYTLNALAAGDITLYSMWGEKVRTIDIVGNQDGGKLGLNQVLWDGRFSGGGLCNNGVYFYVIQLRDTGGNRVAQKGKVVIWKQEEK